MLQCLARNNKTFPRKIIWSLHLSSNIIQFKVYYQNGFMLLYESLFTWKYKTNSGILKIVLLHTSTGHVPTSMTTAPGLSQLPRTKLGIPAAAITISAFLVMFSGSFVKACTVLTVASCLYSRHKMHSQSQTQNA